MNIILLQTPFDKPEDVRVENLGVGYLASALRRDGHEVEIFDAHLPGLNAAQTVSEILRREFDCLAVSAAHAQAYSAIAIIKGIRSKRKDALIILGGYLATLSTDYVLKTCPELDFLIIGEGDISLPEACRHISSGEDWHDAPGVAYLNGAEVIVNQPPPLVTDLDSLPFPARDTLIQWKDSVDGAQVAGSRGCYHRCSFCCIQSFYSRHGHHHPRLRSPESIVDEIQSVIEQTGIRKIGFVDDDFIGVGARMRDRAVRIAELIKARDLRITFSAECRADGVDEEILKLFKDIGLSRVFLGIESGVQRQLDTYNKRTSVAQNKLAIETVRKLGIDLSVGFIMVDPYVTYAEIQENLQFLKDTKLMEVAQVARMHSLMKLKLYPGLPFTEKLREEGLVIDKGLEIDYRFKDPTTAFLLKAMDGLAAVKKAVGK